MFIEPVSETRVPSVRRAYRTSFRNARALRQEGHVDVPRLALTDLTLVVLFRPTEKLHCLRKEYLQLIVMDPVTRARHLDQPMVLDNLSTAV